MDLFDCLGPAIKGEFADRKGDLSRQLFVASDAEEGLAATLADAVPGRRAVVLADARTMQVAGQRVVAALNRAGFDHAIHVLPDDGGHPPVCDDITHRALNAGLPPCDVIVGVGSGVISDLTKWVAFTRGVAGAVFATAASMNGYTAANVAPAIAGVKSLFAARSHLVVATDPAVLAAAPATLTTAGLGDVIAKWVSTADWRMNHLLFQEPFSEAVAGIIDTVENTFLSQPKAIADGSPEAITGLFLALIYSGCAMTLQGSSMPASGGEHLISHALDMRASAHGVTHDLHGRQVGLGTITAAALLHRVAELENPRFSAKLAPLDRAGWGSLSSAVEPHYGKKGKRLEEAVATLARPAHWDQLRTMIVATVPRPERVKRVLSEAGAAHRVADLGLHDAAFHWAILNGPHMRERFTSLDLAFAAGVLPAAADDVMAVHLR